MRTRNSILNPSPNPNSSAMDPQQIQDLDEKEPGATTTPSRADAVDLPDDIVAPAVHLPEAGARRPVTNRKKKAARKHAAGQKKMEALRQCLRPVPFSPGKPLSHYAKHERLFRRLGLWGFATLDFDRDLRADYLASLVSWYDPSTRSSSVADVRIKVSRADLARVLRLPLRKDRNPTEAIEPEVVADAGVPDDLSAVKDFIMNCIFVNAEDALVIPDEITGAIRLLDAGETEKIDWAGLVWSMAEKELSRGPALSTCYYASHFQMLIRSQRPELFEMAEKPIVHASALDSVPAAVHTATEATTVEEVEDEAAKVDDADENEGREEEAKTGSQESELNEVLNEENEMVVEEVDDEQGEQGSLCPCSLNEAGGTSMSPEKLEEDFQNFEQLPLPENMMSLEGNVGLASMSVPQNISMEPNEPDVISMGMDKNFLHLNSSVSEFGNGCKRELEDAHILQNECQKKMRHDAQWDNDFNVCMDHIAMWINKAREIHMEKHESFVNAHLNMQDFTAELRNRDQIISNLQAAQYKMNTELTRMKFELYATANLAQGYKQLLESTRKAFDEYRKQCPQMDEPLFKDVPGGGGLVLTSDELTKRLLEREEEERALMQWVVEEVNDFGDEWTAKFSILQRDVYRMDDRLAILESEFQLLKRRPAKADVGGANPPSN